VRKKSNILVVGAGSIGERHLRCFLATGKAEVSICELTSTLREKMREQYRVTRFYEDYEAALDSQPDAVVICTPAQLHVALASKAVNQGLHALIEKPLSTSTAGVAELQRAVSQHKVVCAVAYVYRAHPSLAAMRDAIRAGQFGSPIQIVAVAGQDFPFYRPAYRETYYQDHRTGGGAVQDALTHVINAAEWLIGPTESLVADLGHLKLDGVTVEDTANVLTRHGNVMGCFTLNQHQAPNETTITVVCEKGTARFEYHASRWRWMTEPGDQWHDEPVGPLERDALFGRQADAFLDAITNESPLLCSLEEATQTLRVNLAILQSAKRRVWERIEAEEHVYA